MYICWMLYEDGVYCEWTFGEHFSKCQLQFLTAPPPLPSSLFIQMQLLNIRTEAFIRLSWENILSDSKIADIEHRGPHLGYLPTSLCWFLIGGNNFDLALKKGNCPARPEQCLHCQHKMYAWYFLMKCASIWHCVTRCNQSIKQE